MSFGIKTFDDDGYVNLHSDYSSLVYVGEFTKSSDPVRPVYEGDYAISILDYEKGNYYDQGWLFQLRFEFDSDNVIPFYRPDFDGQEIGIIDVVNEGTTWVINAVFNGDASNFPRFFAFAPLKDVSNVTLSDNGLAVYDENQNLVFTDSQRPLRIDDVLTVQHPSSIKTGARGTCGRDGTNCHINYTSDQSTTYTGTTTNTNSKIYHVVPSAYGGLAFQNDGTYTRSCGLFGWGDRKYAWAYQSWASFRGTIKHPYNTANHVTGWLGDFSGALYQQASGSCGYSGFLGALLGLTVVLFTGGVGLALIGGALAGFAVGELTAPTSPSLRAYENDEMFDQNSSYELIVTDAQYYNISSANGLDDSVDYESLVYQYVEDPATWWSVSSIQWDQNETTTFVSLWWNGAPVDGSVEISEYATSYTSTMGDVYIRGGLQSSETYDLAGTLWFEDKYEVAFVEYNAELDGAGDGVEDTDSNVPSDIPEVYIGVDSWKNGIFTGVSYWGVYYTGSSPDDTQNTAAFIWYNGSLIYLDWDGSFSGASTTSVTGTDGRTYYRGASHPEDGNPYDNGSSKFLFYGVGRE